MRKLTYVALIAGLVSFTAISCGDGAETETNTEMAENTLYTCPMHPEVTSDAPGDCPKCGMPLEIVTKEEHEEMMMAE